MGSRVDLIMLATPACSALMPRCVVVQSFSADAKKVVYVVAWLPSCACPLYFVSVRMSMSMLLDSAHAFMLSLSCVIR